MGVLLASRKSDLARLQSYQVAEALKNAHPGLEINFHFRQSLGDINQNDPLWKMPEKGVFTEDFREGLLDGSFDMVVHSWKDLPVEMGAGTEIIATLPRADARDLFLFKKSCFEKVKTQRSLKVFTSSPRRIYNLAPFFKNYFYTPLDTIEFESVRGNIQTRIDKLLASNEVDGLVVAKAAIDRLLLSGEEDLRSGKEKLKTSLQKLYWQVLPLSINPTAAAQGALAIEIANHRQDLRDLLSVIHCQDTFQAVSEERRILKSYGGGCHQKIGIHQTNFDFGRVTFLRGLTDAGEVLDHQSLEVKSGSDGAWTELAPPEDFDPCPMFKLFDRKPLNSKKPVDCDAHFIARANALPESIEIGPDEILWVSGLQTWKRLAFRGLWVHGSFDSFGESQGMGLEALAPQRQWAKWTHKGAPSGPWQVTVPSYQLIETWQTPEEPAGKDFFWTSGSRFAKAVECFPSLLSKRHYCGPGNTFQQIVQVLKEHQINQKPQVLMGFEQWSQWCEREGQT
ncbi:MAG: hydroxymethylbilane synthase [Bdellovibrionales bacterium]|nr:hydroxymethylbilane synthase [Bdellovibrionales bacterium]